MNEFHFDNLKHAFYAREVFSYFEEIGTKTPKGYKIIYKDLLNICHNQSIRHYFYLAYYRISMVN